MWPTSPHSEISVMANKTIPRSKKAHLFVCTRVRYLSKSHVCKNPCWAMFNKVMVRLAHRKGRMLFWKGQDTHYRLFFWKGWPADKFPELEQNSKHFCIWVMSFSFRLFNQRTKQFVYFTKSTRHRTCNKGFNQLNLRFMTFKTLNRVSFKSYVEATLERWNQVSM